jgi:hypothetical protein
MGSFPRGTVLHLKCPTCSWEKAVLAYEEQGVGTAFCPHCQHLWNVALPEKGGSATILVFSPGRQRRRESRGTF